MIEAGAPSTDSLACGRSVVPTPPGANMVAPSEVPRNAGVQSERPRLRGWSRRGGQGQYKGRSPVPWEVWEFRPKCPAGTEGGKPRPDYCLPNLTPWSLSVVSIRCSTFKARFDAGRFLL
jgi:hypothetical protein